MTVQLILFLILALVAIASALGMLISRNAIYSALFLVVNFATVAVFFPAAGCTFHRDSPGERVYRGDHGLVPIRDHAPGCRTSWTNPGDPVAASFGDHLGGHSIGGSRIHHLHQ